MRTPNCSCLVCAKPLYRRPNELARVRHVACMAHRAKAQTLSGITEAQHAALALGRPKGTNHRKGYKHRAESKAKCAISNKEYWSAHPELAAARGVHTRGEKNRLWKGGATQFNQSIRQMTENRRWMEAIRARDKSCCSCGSTKDLESHHEPPLVELIEALNLKTRDGARRNAKALWSLDNGFALCRPCHYATHGRTFIADHQA